MTSSLADPARTGLWITDFGPVRRAMMHRMSFDDLPDNWPELPLTDQRLLADVLDLVVSEQSRRDGALYVLLCDEHARLMQPMAIDLLEAPADPDARRQLMASVIDVTKHLGEKGSYVVAIARRGGDTGALATHWFAGMDVLAEYSIDLFSLLPLGELWMAAARLRQPDRVSPALEQAFGLLESLGNPPTWTAMLHWAGVHAGILSSDPAALAPHGQALAAMAEHSPFAAVLAHAGRAWLQVLANHVDPGEVVAASRGLAQFGLTSDATRLAGQAALQAADPKVSALMLQVARDLKLGAGEDPADAAGAAATERPRPVATALSDREREVAELLLLGMPYRDIGAQLFISAKTVEHHVARIRRRLGAESRSEMLSMLRATLGSE